VSKNSQLATSEWFTLGNARLCPRRPQSFGNYSLLGDARSSQTSPRTDVCPSARLRGRFRRRASRRRRGTTCHGRRPQPDDRDLKIGRSAVRPRPWRPANPKFTGLRGPPDHVALANGCQHQIDQRSQRASRPNGVTRSRCAMDDPMKDQQASRQWAVGGPSRCGPRYTARELVARGLRDETHLTRSGKAPLMWAAVGSSGHAAQPCKTPEGCCPSAGCPSISLTTVRSRAGDARRAWKSPRPSTALRRLSTSRPGRR